MKHFVTNSSGLGIEVLYTLYESPYTETTTRIVTQIRDGYKRRKITDDSMSDEQSFLIELSFKPKKNDKITYDGEIWYIDTFERVSSEMWRVFCEGNKETVPSPTGRLEV